MFSFDFEKKNYNALTFNIVHFANFEISVSLYLAPHLAVSKFDKHRGHILEEIMYIISNYFCSIQRI